MISTVLNISQIIISISLVTVVLLQQRGTGGTGIFGMGSGTAYHTKRGAEKFLFSAAIGLSSLFIATAFLDLLF